MEPTVATTLATVEATLTSLHAEFIGFKQDLAPRLEALAHHADQAQSAPAGAHDAGALQRLERTLIDVHELLAAAQDTSPPTGRLRRARVSWLAVLGGAVLGAALLGGALHLGGLGPTSPPQLAALVTRLDDSLRGGLYRRLDARGKAQIDAVYRASGYLSPAKQ